MKKLLIILLAVFTALTLVGCVKENKKPTPNPDPIDPVQPTPNPEVKGLKFNGGYIGGDKNDFPKEGDNTSSRKIVDRTVTPVISNTYEFTAPQKYTMNLMNLTPTPVKSPDDPLYLYFTWDGTIKWFDKFEGDVDTRRNKQPYSKTINVLDYWHFQAKDSDFGGFIPFVNYIRYQIISNGKTYMFFDGEPVVESLSTRSFIIDNQSIELDESKKFFKITVTRNFENEKAKELIKNDPEARVQIIGIQLFVGLESDYLRMMAEGQNIYERHNILVEGEKPSYVESVDVDEEAYCFRNADGEEYAYYESSTGVLSRRMASVYNNIIARIESHTRPGVPTKDFYLLKKEDLEKHDVVRDHLRLFRVYFNTSDINDFENAKLEESRIEYSGGSKEPFYGLKKDLNPEADKNIVYVSAPVYANTYNIYSDSFLKDTGFGSTVLLTLRSKKPSSFLLDYNNRYYKPLFWKQNFYRMENNIPDKIPFENENVVDIISISLNKEIRSLKTGELIYYPGTNEPIKMNMELTKDYRFQGFIPITLPTDVAIEDLELEVNYDYLYKNDIFGFDNTSRAAELDETIKDIILNGTQTEKWAIGGRLSEVMLEYIFDNSIVPIKRDFALLIYNFEKDSNGNITIKDNSLKNFRNTYRSYKYIWKKHKATGEMSAEISVIKEAEFRTALCYDLVISEDIETENIIIGRFYINFLIEELAFRRLYPGQKRLYQKFTDEQLYSFISLKRL